jgi:acyl carrier protein
MVIQASGNSRYREIKRVIGIRIDARETATEGHTRESDSVKEDNQVSMDEVDVQAIENKVIEIISEQMGVDKSEITRDTSFINDLNADSLDTVELVMEFEDEFDMSIPDEEAEKIQTSVPSTTSSISPNPRRRKARRVNG